MGIRHSNNPCSSLLLCFVVLLLLVSSCLGNSNVGVRCMESERQQLLDFKEGLMDPFGRLSSWVGLDCCKWQGVRCKNRTGHVTVLNLQNYHLGGTIKPSLLHLKHLTHLNLAENFFGGTQIPKFLGMLNNLRYLDLYSSGYGGEIPPHLGNLSHLQVLYLGGNFGLRAESLVWLSGLSSLESLDLGRVDLYDVRGSWLKAVNMLPSLVRLYLEGCQLKSLDLTLPSLNLTSLEVLDLFDNPIKSPLPHWFSNLTNLQVLDLRSNNFYGSIPFWIGSLCKLRILRLNSNRLHGGIMGVFDRFSACQNNSLEILYLGGNYLVGSLPQSLGALRNLQELDLNTNFFWGSIPASIGNLSSLELLELSDNNFNGTIPESFGRLAKLSTVSLVSNQMEGVLTETHLANLTRLDAFRLTTYHNKSLVFNLKHDWVPPFRLTTLVLINCLIGPSFPVWLLVQTNLSYVIVSNAGISDIVEEEWFARLFSSCWFVDLSNNSITAKLPPRIYSEMLEKVDLSRNNFVGQIPLWETNATQLYLQRNSFSGSIPENIGELMPRLKTFFVSRNQISGRLPSSICKMMGLKFLSVSHNRLSGQLPYCWNKLRSLKVVDASNNSLSGEIPSSLTSLCHLILLMLGDNNLHGDIPFPPNSCRQVPLLYILQLRSNLLGGNIPEEICRLSNMRSLDLSNNHLIGSIPKCLYNFTALKYGNSSLDYEELFDLQDGTINEQTMLVGTKGRELEYSRTLLEVKNIDLSENNLIGEFPKGICRLAFLDTLNLSTNYLSGSIPDNIGDMRWLESLDLSVNKFSGPIPSSLSSLTLLNHLKLSYNNLSGRIPTGYQLQTLNDSSNYQGNPLLCGVPLLTRCPGDINSPPTPSSLGGSKDKLWLYLSIAMGYIVGFWGVCGTLVMKESWRQAYFRYVDELKEKLLLWIALTIARSRRMIEKGNN
ncbi:hypothetical protein Godav_006594 [Gossypium davidsonii]|uniref:Leucine-rich repeat-containing N-terminal plant-type domain-containing protein n=1 Tax=Gossypium davidsonii TaxID=34287 RepID=A0A7J8S493_GOSDV|nr:hypothetical protein [Gossypium davidsonii]